MQDIRKKNILEALATRVKKRNKERNKERNKYKKIVQIDRKSS